MRVPSLVSTLRSAEPGYCSFAWAAGELGEGERVEDKATGRQVNQSTLNPLADFICSYYGWSRIAGCMSASLTSDP